MLLLAFLCSEDRRRIPWRTVICGVGLQIAFALLLIGVPGADRAMFWLNDAANALHAATLVGTQFVFGYLGGGAPAFAETHPGASFILAFQALPLVLTISALASLLFYWGVLQRITAGFAWLLRRSMGISGPLALGAAVHVFVGMVEAPLLVRPYLARMQRGELFALMTCGMAGVAGHGDDHLRLVPGAVRAERVGQHPDRLDHQHAGRAGGRGADGAVRWLRPAGRRSWSIEDPPHSSLDALVKGTMDGVPILAAIIADAAGDGGAGHAGEHGAGAAAGLGRRRRSPCNGCSPCPFRPVMWLIGVPWAETGAASMLMATKTVLNEFVAYLNFSQLPPETFSPRSRMILTYALCGFANFGSLGIMIGGLGAMVPARRAEIVGLGLRTILSGTLATCMSGAVAGALVGG